MTATAKGRQFHRRSLAPLADWLAVAVAVSLPWSTSVTGVLIALWLVAFAPTLERASLRRALAHPAGGIPVLLWLVAALGTLWAEVPWRDALAGLSGPHKLLVIPLLFAQFRESERGAWVIGGFFASCTLLLAVSYVTYAFPALMFWREHTSGYLFAGIPTKDYLIQSGEFVLCIFAAIHFALDAWRANRPARSLAWTALALAFLVNVVFLAPGRSPLIVFAALVILIVLQRLGWKGSLAVVAGAMVLGAAAWTASPLLRARVELVAQDVASYRQGQIETSTGYRIALWKNALEFIASAPLVGHGTGSVSAMFRQAAGDDPRLASIVTGNPHNMTFRVGIQLGLLGVAVLYAMWGAHLLLFAGRGLIAWLGLAWVVSDIISSVFLSHLFDFTTGWTYVFGVGVLGGMLLREDIAAHAPDRLTAVGWRPVANAANE